MNRRQLLRAATAATLLAPIGLRAADAQQVPYTRAVYEAALASGKPFMLDFYATW